MRDFTEIKNKLWTIAFWLMWLIIPLAVIIDREFMEDSLGFIMSLVGIFIIIFIVIPNVIHQEQWKEYSEQHRDKFNDEVK